MQANQEQTSILLTTQNLSIDAAFSAVQSERCGAVDVFVGSVRAETGGRRVKRLEYEAYEAMAHKELQAIANEVVQNIAQNIKKDLKSTRLNSSHVD